MKKGVYNPTSEDFQVNYDIKGNGSPEPLKALAGEITYFEDHLAEHVKKHLAKKIVFERGVRTNFDDEYANVIKEISVE